MQAVDPTLQPCSGPCHRWLDPDTDFYRGQRYCKDCAKERINQWKRENYRKRINPDPALQNVPIVIRPADLVSINGIAERLGVTRMTVQYWIRRDARFPLPIARLGAKSPVWDFRAVQAYVTQTQQRRSTCQT